MSYNIRSDTDVAEKQHAQTEEISIRNEYTITEQIAFPPPHKVQHSPVPLSSQKQARPASQAAVSAVIPVVKRPPAPELFSPTGPKRQPLYIHGKQKRYRRKCYFSRRSLVRMRLWAHGATFVGLIFILASTLLATIPADSHGLARFQHIFSPITHLTTIDGKQSNNKLRSQFGSTPTLDWDPQGAMQWNNTGRGEPSASNNALVGTGNWFPYGQCTYWANSRYHYYAGVWVPWMGNAEEWLDGARRSGWQVSLTPVIPSIIVFQRFVQGSSGIGHVAVAESLYPDGSALASNWNWNGNWDRTVYTRVYAGAGIVFVSFPGR